MAKLIDEDRRQALCAWLTANGIDPKAVPVDADMTIDKGPTGRFLRCEVFDRDRDGRIKVDERGEGPARLVINVPLKLEPPDWWEPYQKPTRDELLDVLGRVYQLAERWKHTGDRKNGPRQELLQALGGHAMPDAP
ncbi:hypothetical protein ABZX39_33685 [Streptomyces collinus]|uniref:hypothetical protein n=1 Tax=Streptomyces collinus TaxID=42684 RepID=UPI0033A09635